MRDYALYCVENTVYKKLYTKLRTLPNVSDLTVMSRSVFGYAIQTDLTTVACDNQIVWSVLTRKYDHHTIVGLSRICTHNESLTQELHQTLRAIGENVVANKQGEVYQLELNEYNRFHLRELEPFFPTHSRIVRDVISKEGRITLDLCDKVTPLAIVGQLVFPVYFNVVFDIPDDVQKELNPYGIRIDKLRRELAEASANHK